MPVLRKVKEKLKKIMQSAKSRSGSGVRTRRPSPLAGLAKRLTKRPAKAGGTVAIEQEKKEIPGYQETAVGTAKFYTGSQPRAHRPMPSELSEKYGEDRIVLQVRDSWWIHAYWEVRDDTLERLRRELKDEFYRSRRILRVYDVSHIMFNGSNAHRSFDIHINDFASNWYIDTGGPGRSWCVDLGLLLGDGRFITIVRSNIVYTPLEGPSWITDEEWMVPEEMFARLYGMGFGLGQSSPVGKAWQERIRKELSSGVLSSPGMASMASPVKKAVKERKFWLVVDCELIVYGATEPDAKVTVQGKPVNLRPDGTFTLRYYLPDGKQVIPVKAVSSDREEERAITPIVTRETH
jgi:hypothetical protein